MTLLIATTLMHRSNLTTKTKKFTSDKSIKYKIFSATLESYNGVCLKNIQGIEAKTSKSVFGQNFIFLRNSLLQKIKKGILLHH